MVNNQMVDTPSAATTAAPTVIETPTTNPCLYGAHCQRKKCRFNHPTPPQPTNDSTSTTRTAEEEQQNIVRMVACSSSSSKSKKKNNNSSSKKCRYGAACRYKATCPFQHPPEAKEDLVLFNDNDDNEDHTPSPQQFLKKMSATKRTDNHHHPNGGYHHHHPSDSIALSCNESQLFPTSGAEPVDGGGSIESTSGTGDDASPLPTAAASTRLPPGMPTLKQPMVCATTATPAVANLNTAAASSMTTTLMGYSHPNQQQYPLPQKPITLEEAEDLYAGVDDDGDDIEDLLRQQEMERLHLAATAAGGSIESVLRQQQRVEEERRRQLELLQQQQAQELEQQRLRVSQLQQQLEHERRMRLHAEAMERERLRIKQLRQQINWERQMKNKKKDDLLHQQPVGQSLQQKAQPRPPQSPSQLRQPQSLTRKAIPAKKLSNRDPVKQNPAAKILTTMEPSGAYRNGQQNGQHHQFKHDNSPKKEKTFRMVVMETSPPSTGANQRCFPQEEEEENSTTLFSNEEQRQRQLQQQEEEDLRQAIAASLEEEMSRQEKAAKEIFSFEDSKKMEEYRAQRNAKKKERRRMERENKIVTPGKLPPDEELAPDELMASNPSSKSEESLRLVDTTPASTAEISITNDVDGDENIVPRADGVAPNNNDKTVKTKETKAEKKHKKHQLRLLELEKEAAERAAFWQPEIAHELDAVPKLVQLGIAELCRKPPHFDQKVMAVHDLDTVIATLTPPCRDSYRKLFDAELHSHIVIKGMGKKQQEMNDRYGTILFWDESKSKYQVAVEAKRAIPLPCWFNHVIWNLPPTRTVKRRKE
jgi:hypothetical protein